jgi:hypothetical protein
LLQHSIPVSSLVCAHFLFYSRLCNTASSALLSTIRSYCTYMVEFIPLPALLSSSIQHHIICVLASRSFLLTMISSNYNDDVTTNYLVDGIHGSNPHSLLTYEVIRNHLVMNGAKALAYFNDYVGDYLKVGDFVRLTKKSYYPLGRMDNHESRSATV